MARTHRSSAAAALLERAVARAIGMAATNHVAHAKRIANALDGLEGLAANRNPTETAEAHALRVSKAARSLEAEVAIAKGRMGGHLSEAASALGQKISERTGLNGVSRHGEEIRAVFRGMKSDKRLDTIKAAMDAKDTDLLNAVLMAPPILTGLDPKYIADMRTVFERTIAPELTEELEALMDVDAEAYEVLRVADMAAKEAVRPDYVASIMAAAAKAEAAQAEFTAAVAPPMATY